MRKLPGTGKKHPPNPNQVIVCCQESRGGGFPSLNGSLQNINKEQEEWSREHMVVSYSAITGGHVKVQGFGFNPHIVEEEEDDLEVVNEVLCDDDVVEVMEDEGEGPSSPVSPGTMKKRRKASKARRS